MKPADDSFSFALNESPSEKEGKCPIQTLTNGRSGPSMKVPPKRKGNTFDWRQVQTRTEPSMKVPPKRKGNNRAEHGLLQHRHPQ